MARTLRREEATLKLNSRAFDVLLYLVQNPGKVLTRDELLKNVWQDAFVDENSLAQSISQLRRVLEEKPGDNSIIVTLPGRGYQFGSEVQVVAPEDGNTVPEAATADSSGSNSLIFRRHTVETTIVTDERKAELSSPISRSRTLMSAVAAVLAVVVAAGLVVRFRSPRPPEPKRELAEKQLTANPPENRINSSTLSRDGKYLAYSDSLSKNLYLLAIDSGEIREVPMSGDYAPLDWFPEGNHLLMSGHAEDLWKMSTWDFSLRKLWGGRALYAVVSPDGSHIAFVNGHDLWLMGGDGEEPHQILTGAADDLSSPAWSPSGQRLAYIRGSAGKPDLTIETCDLAGGTRTVVLSDPKLISLNAISGVEWLPDGRILYSITSGTNESNLWARIADPSSGRPSSDATRLAGWKNFEARDPHASADGKRLVATREHTENGIYLGDLAIGDKTFNPHRFTADDWYNLVTDWTKDSKAFIITSKRNGKWVILKQKIDAKTPETLIAGSENYLWPKLGAQGTVLYTAAAPSNPRGQATPASRLMSTPEQGGARTTLMNGGYRDNYYACGSSPSSSCVVSELKDGHLIFFHLDPVKGKGEEMARIDGYQSSDPRWDLSPDGARVAIVDPLAEGKGEIRILNLADRRVTVLPVRNWKWDEARIVSWAADGKSWFMYALSQHSPDALVSVDANGDLRVLQEIPAGNIISIVPSPDGKRLAFTKRMFVDDVMLLENF